MLLVAHLANLVYGRRASHASAPRPEDDPRNGAPLSVRPRAGGARPDQRDERRGGSREERTNGGPAVPDAGPCVARRAGTRLRAGGRGRATRRLALRPRVHALGGGARRRRPRARTTSAAGPAPGGRGREGRDSADQPAPRPGRPLAGRHGQRALLEPPGTLVVPRVPLLSGTRPVVA